MVFEHEGSALQITSRTRKFCNDSSITLMEMDISAANPHMVTRAVPGQDGALLITILL